jgi:hypothetical protein
MSTRKWSAHHRSRFFSGGFEFATFAECIEWHRQGWANVLRDVRRFPEYQGQRDEYRCTIDGPGGTLDWATLRALVTGETR